MSSSSHKKLGVICVINVIIDLCNALYFWSGVAAAEGKEEENKTKHARARGMTQEMRRDAGADSENKASYVSQVDFSRSCDVCLLSDARVSLMGCAEGQALTFV